MSVAEMKMLMWMSGGVTREDKIRNKRWYRSDFGRRRMRKERLRWLGYVLRTKEIEPVRLSRS